MESINAYIPTILQGLLFALMLGMGMTLHIQDFKRVAQYPKAAIIGVFNQIIFLPIIGLIVISIIPMEPAMAMGIMLVSCCPGGATSNLISHLSHGDTALSISLTALSSLLTVISIPIIINLSLGHIMGAEGTDIVLPFGKTVVGIVKLTALPVAIGMFINHYFPKFSKSSQPFIAWGSGIVIILALFLMVMKLEEIGSTWGFVKASLLGVIALNLISLAFGFFSSRIFNLNRKQSVTISIETGLQNNVLGMALAASPTFLNAPEMGAPAGVYGLTMCFTAVILIYFFRKLIAND